MRRRRSFFAPAFALAALLPIPFTAGVALAAPTMCDPGTNVYTVAVTSKDILATHGYRYVTLAPGASASRTITHTTSFMASFTVSTGVKASAGVIFAQAEASLGFQLQLAGTWTDSTAVGLSVTNSTTGNHTWVFFDGTKRGSGTWKWRKCNSNGSAMTQIGAGSWGSWNAQHDGVLRCDDDSAVLHQYGSFSMEYTAVRTC